MFFDEFIVKLSCISIVTSESSLPVQESSTRNTANREQTGLTIKFYYFVHTVVKEYLNKGLSIRNF